MTPVTKEKIKKLQNDDNPEPSQGAVQMGADSEVLIECMTESGFLDVSTLVCAMGVLADPEVDSPSAMIRYGFEQGLGLGFQIGREYAAAGLDA